MINKDSINKAAEFLNDAKALVETKSLVSAADLQALAQSHNCGADIFYAAVNQGVFKRVKRGAYVVNEPLTTAMVRQVLKARKKAYTKRTVTTKKDEVAKTKPFKASFLWGLIKIG